MLTLASKLKREEGVRAGRTPAGSNDASHRVSIRDRLLIKGTHQTLLLSTEIVTLERWFVPGGSRPIFKSVLMDRLGMDGLCDITLCTKNVKEIYLSVCNLSFFSIMIHHIVIRSLITHF